jgi:hypothetical protein
MSNVNTAIKRLARNCCANFTGNNECLLEPNGQPRCTYYREDTGFPADDLRCFTFERSVLPSDPALESRYWNKPTDNNAKCASCGSEYVKRSNRQKYCDKCKTQAETDARRKRDARYRDKAR